MPSAAQISSTRPTSAGARRQDDRVREPGRAVRCEAGPGPDSRGPAARRTRCSGPLSTADRPDGVGDRARKRTGARAARALQRSARLAGSASPSSERRAASASAPSSTLALRVPPAPPLHRRRVRIGGRFPVHVSARSIPSRASSRRCRVAGRIIGEPSRDRPRSRSLLTRVTASRRRRASSRISKLRGAQDPLERRALDLLLPHVALAGRRGGAAVVGPHALAPLRSRAPWSSGCASPGRHPHVLDPHRARPPPGQVMRVGDQVPDRSRQGHRSSACESPGHWLGLATKSWLGRGSTCDASAAAT